MSTKTPGTVAGGFTLSADNALLGLQLAGCDELGKIVLTNPAESKTYTLTCTGVKLTSEAKVFYIVVPAAEWTDGFTVDVYNSESTLLKTYTKSSTAEFAAGKAMMMPAKALGLFFSVGADKKVEFSKGNLQYHPKNKKWRFAESQLDYIGAANNDENFKNAEYDGWLDLFGWSSTKSEYGMLKTEFFKGGFAVFVDWGQNQIGTDAANTWRTLSWEEWEYLVETRSNADQLYGVAQVAGVNGLILLPDIWICPSGISFKFGNHNDDGVEYYAAHQSFTAEEWAKLEDAGAIFLPAAGERFHYWGPDWTIWLVQRNGCYWSSTRSENGDDYNPMSDCLSFTSQTAGTSYWDCYSGLSVRLVKDLE